MKKSNIPYMLLFLLNVAIALSCYLYPVSRDQFYYLEKVNTPNLFAEYYHSYLHVNPRIGQFFSNFVSRILLVEVIFGVLLFNGFVAVLFLNVYRRLPKLSREDDIRKLLIITAFFVLLLSYFGEMFYYTPFSTNYTLTHLFYLIFVFLFTEYYLFEREEVLNKINYFLLLLFGLFIGMGNEHIPPVLLMISFIGGIYYLIRNRKFPNLRLIVLPIFICIGYLLLFFAPANSIKEKVVGKSVFDIGITSYITNLGKIFKFYLYYNLELIVVILIIIGAGAVFRNKIKISLTEKWELLVYFSLFALPLFIVAVSPLIGTRLLFFSTVMIIIILYKLCAIINSYFQFRHLYRWSNVFLFCFFTFSLMITFRAQQNYNAVINNIKIEKLKSNDIILNQGFNYFDNRFGTRLNRKILLESGQDYIGTDAAKNTAIEKNMINFFRLNSIKKK